MFGKLLKRREVWLPLRIAGVLVFLNVFLYLAAVVSPEANTRGLPVAVVNEDAGAVSPGGGPVNLGGEFVEGVLSSSRSGEAVEWIRLGTREEALERISKGELYGALVVPRDYSGRLVDLARLAAEPPGGSPDGPIRPAKIQILTNPAAGPTVSNTVQGFTSEAVEHASRVASERLTDDLAQRGVRIVPQAASVVAEPVRAGFVEAETVGGDSGRGLMPFYLTFLAALSGFVGANVVHGSVSGVAGGLTGAGEIARPRRAALWSAKLVLGFAMALLAAGVQTATAVWLLGVDHEAGVVALFLFLALATSVSLVGGLVFLAAFGPALGSGLGSLVMITAGQVTSGGSTPLEALPGVYRAVADWLPFRYVTDGIRAQLFYDGRLDAGLGTALWVLGTYLIAAAAVGGAISVAQDRLAVRRKDVPAPNPALEPAEPPEEVPPGRPAPETIREVERMSH